MRLCKKMNHMKNSLLIIVLLLLPCTAFVDSADKLPKVLIIGDSISMGYLPYVQEMLKGKAMVDRPPPLENGKPENCQGTTHGLVRIDAWLGDTKWDVIHFNFGLHDLKHIDPETGENSKNLNDPLQADLKQYEKNLKEIVVKLEATGAKLIFATTTPYPDTLGNQIRSPGMPVKYNKAALKIMKRHGIEVNDLYALVLPRMKELQQANNVHFTEAGSKVLGQQVAKHILDNL